jgi:hypothetical protein
MGAVNGTEESLNPQLAALFAGSLVWDNHGCLMRLGYGAEDLRAILGGNHLRIAHQVWR